jgi:hypothetical protein
MTKMEEMAQAMSLLFRDSESTCYAKLDKGTSVFPVNRPPQWVQFFCANPLYQDFNYSPKGDPMIGRRADINVSAYRNFVLELDSMTSEEQYQYMESFKVPWATCIFSGKKSLHFIIALEESLADKKEYDFFAAWIHKIIPKVDPACRNVSRLTRFPGVKRLDTGREQTIVGLRKRVTRAELETWLNQWPELRPQPRKPKPRRVFGEGQRDRLHKSTAELLEFGAEVGQRHRRLLLAAFNLLHSGYTIEESLNALMISPAAREKHPDEVRKIVEFADARMDQETEEALAQGGQDVA